HHRAAPAPHTAGCTVAAPAAGGAAGAPPRRRVGGLRLSTSLHASDGRHVTHACCARFPTPCTMLLKLGPRGASAGHRLEARANTVDRPRVCGTAMVFVPSSDSLLPARAGV